MTTAEQTERPDRSRQAALREWTRDNATTTVGLVAAITFLGLVLRLVLLGDRIAHWDEGRVAYWILYYQESGSFAYRHIIHGPLVQHANRWLFALVGANDFTMRLPVALVGTALPLTALLFREHLRKAEVVAMALFLALNPVLLYYSRFMRSDVLVAAFMFAAFGYLVRFYDTRRFRYVYVAAALMACGFASKENAIVYVLTWLGATALLVEHALFRPHEYDSGYELLAAKAGAARRQVSTARGRVVDRVIDYGFHLVFAAVLFFLVSLFFYAPRGAGIEGLQYPPAPPTAGAIGLWEGIFDPTKFPAMVDGTIAHVIEEFSKWGGKGPMGGEQRFTEMYGDQPGQENAVFFVTDDFVSYLGQYVEVMGTKAAPLTAFAIFGFVLERFGSARSRNLVLFAAYGGFVSVVGYPLGTDVFGAWLVVHALVPLSIPAAVGLTRVYDWGYEAFAADDDVGVAIAAVLLVLVAGQVAWVGGTSVYVNDQSRDNALVQYAQPGGEVRPALANISRAGAGEEPDEVLLYYGEQGDQYDGGNALVEKDRSGWNTSRLYYRPLCAKWFNTLPLPWYLEDSGADLNCERTASGLESRVGAGGPAVIITAAGDSTVPEATLERHYVAQTYEMRAWETETTYWVNEEWYERQTE